MAIRLKVEKPEVRKMQNNKGLRFKVTEPVKPFKPRHKAGRSA